MAKILVVEDDNALREINQAALEAAGFTVVTATDGENGLTMAVKEKPDLILSDVMMPKISGFEMLDIIRSTPEIKDTKVIMLTALSDAEQQAKADKFGADRYMVKSQLTMDDVINTINELLGLKNPAAEQAKIQDIVDEGLKTKTQPDIVAPTTQPTIMSFNDNSDATAAPVTAQVSTTMISPIEEPAEAPKPDLSTIPTLVSDIEQDVPENTQAPEKAANQEQSTPIIEQQMVKQGTTPPTVAKPTDSTPLEIQHPDQSVIAPEDESEVSISHENDTPLTPEPAAETTFIEASPEIDKAEAITDPKDDVSQPQPEQVSHLEPPTLATELETPTEDESTKAPTTPDQINEATNTDPNQPEEVNNDKINLINDFLKYRPK